MVDTLQEVRVPRVPSRRGWQASYEAMLGKAGQRVRASIAPDHILCHLSHLQGRAGLGKSGSSWMTGASCFPLLPLNLQVPLGIGGLQVSFTFQWQVPQIRTDALVRPGDTSSSSFQPPGRLGADLRTFYLVLPLAALHSGLRHSY